jgi:Heparinase II/III-like protein
VLNRLGLRLSTFQRLGWNNAARVIAYRWLLRLRLHPVQRITAEPPEGLFFRETSPVPLESLAIPLHWRAFGWMEQSLGGHAPDWSKNLLTGAKAVNNSRPWWEYSDFDPSVGDIKALWEASRFSWVPLLALAARQGDRAALTRLNAWLADWLKNNPPYLGRQWKCGQEASIRVMNLVVAALILEQHQTPELPLLDLLNLHLQRIAPTMGYARAQNNNHGTSEAAALFMGGLLLGKNRSRASRRFCDNGRFALEERVQALFNAQGGFSQYSVNYHRMALDTLSMAEAVRRAFKAPEFSSALVLRAGSAARWLFDRSLALGDAPNLGANDGTNLLCTPEADYPDHRPSIQLAMTLFNNCRAYPPDPSIDTPLKIMGLQAPSNVCMTSQESLDEEGGTFVSRSPYAMVLVRLPRFVFRPSQADAHHVDLWVHGENILCDGGTFSYNTDEATYRSFCSVEGHNTIQFDGHDQMVPLGRFLYGGWLQSRIWPVIQQDGSKHWIETAYLDRWNCHHTRKISFAPGELDIIDNILGFSQAAVLRWHLADGGWTLQKESDCAFLLRRHSGKNLNLRVFADQPFEARLVETRRSRFYGKAEPALAFSATFRHPGKLETQVRWQA